MSDRTNLTIRLRECADSTLRLIDRNVMLEALGAIRALEAERDEARALLREARAFVAMWHERADLLTRIDAPLAEKEGTT